MPRRFCHAQKLPSLTNDFQLLFDKEKFIRLLDQDLPCPIQPHVRSRILIHTYLILRPFSSLTLA